MKKIFFSLFLLCSTMVFAQHNVPSTVRRNFQRDNPTVSNPQWQQKNGEWHAKYRDENNRDVDASYDRYGKRIDAHIGWDRKDVPDVVDKSVNLRWHANGNYTVRRIERPRSKPLFEINIGGKTHYMDEEGKEQKYSHH